MALTSKVRADLRSDVVEEVELVWLLVVFVVVVVEVVALVVVFEKMVWRRGTWAGKQKELEVSLDFTHATAKNT